MPDTKDGPTIEELVSTLQEIIPVVGTERIMFEEQLTVLGGGQVIDGAGFIRVTTCVQLAALPQTSVAVYTRLYVDPLHSVIPLVKVGPDTTTVDVRVH